VRVLVDYRPALKERTGVGEYVHELVRALVQAPDPDEVALFTASWKDRPSPDLRLDLAGARVVDRRVPGRLLTLAWNRLAWPPIEWLAGRFDVVHAASPLAIPSRSAAVVLTIHDLHFLRHPERMAAEMRRDFPNLVRLHARRAPAIVVSSAYTAGDVRRTLDVPPDRIHLCPPGAPGWAAAVRERRRTEPTEHILFLGTLDPRKNVGVLLEAYRQLRGRRRSTPALVLAGGVPPSAAHWVETAARAELAGHVRLTGYVSQAERQDLLAGAHMLVLPSLDEGFGLPVLEAMACGVPVVVSSGGSLPEVAGEAATPVAPTDVDGLAAAMASLLEPDVARDASARGLARAAAFRWDDCAERVRQAYGAAARLRP
jgi:glycosyltransferase involved in cell wall biosynthesis